MEEGELAAREKLVIAGGSVPCPAGRTVTCTVDCAFPYALVAVSVYAVVAAGLTTVEPDALLLVNDPGAIDTETAPETDHASVEFCPKTIEAGVALNELTVGGGTVTVTVAVPCKLPLALVAVRVYVVVAGGETCVDPDALPLVNEPGVTEIEVAPEVAQDSVLDCP